MNWDDPTGGLSATGGGATDAAFVWLPLPEPDRYRWLVVAEEPRLVLLPSAHPLAGREAIDIADLLDQPFLALPSSAGSLRDYWLALDARDGRPPIIGVEIASTDETAEALLAGLGVCLIAAGNAEPFRRDGITTRPVTGLSDSQLALAWRADDSRPLLRALINATAAARPNHG